MYQLSSIRNSVTQTIGAIACFGARIRCILCPDIFIIIYSKREYSINNNYCTMYVIIMVIKTIIQ